MSSDLQLDFGTIYKQVSDFLATGTSPTGAALTKAKNLTYRGYRRFLMPLNLRSGRSHIWSFLRQTGSISLQSGVWEYELPSDFDSFWYAPTYAKDTLYPNPQPTSMSSIIGMRSSNSFNSYPAFWSLNTEKYTVESGTQYALVLYPTPNSAMELVYGYMIEPDKPTDDSHYFIGGALASEVILECALAEAELQEDDKIGEHGKRAVDLLQTMVERDVKKAMPSLGMQRGIIDPALQRELHWYTGSMTVYGVDS